MTTPATKSETASANLTPAEIAQAKQRLSDSLKRIATYDDPAVWIHRLTSAQVEAQFDRAADRAKRGVPQPLFGLTFAIKDNIDLAGAPTTAACPAFKYTAAQSATVVQKLCDAGAIAIGKTNLDQFATGLVGVRSPYGIARNPFNADYIPGGSSSGSAVAVSAGLVDFSLGTDTAGSGRVPAAFNNLVGIKPSRGLLSNSGLVPACRSLDCISIFAKTCRLAGRVFDIAKGPDETDPFSRSEADLVIPQIPKTTFHFGVPKQSQLQFFGNSAAESLYKNAITRAIKLGGVAVEIDYAPFIETAKLLYGGPWVAERYLACKSLIDEHPEALLPVTRGIIEPGKKISAADVFTAQYKLAALQRRSKQTFQTIDVLLLPTTGTIYTVKQVLADPVQLNTNLGYYTNFVNLLDLAGVAIPAGFQPDGMPAGMSLFAPAGTDAQLIALATKFETELQGESK